MLVHGNLRYVKLGLIGLLTALAIASPARAELVTGEADHGLLAVAADGTPYVAYTVGRDLFMTLRTKQGRWQAARLGRLPGANVTLAGIRVSERPHRYVSILAEDLQGRWLSLARGSRVTSIARPAAGSSLGPAGLTLDARERPAIAYAVQRASGKTFLRLVTFGQGVRPRTRAITQKGFPTSDLPPGAAPVLVNGRLHVVETYTSAAIDWAPKARSGWEGQYLFASRDGTPQGRVGAVFLPSTLWSAWTQVYPDELVVLLTSSSETQTTWTLTHGIFVSIAQGENAPEVAAYDWVNLAEDWPVYAGVVVQGPDDATWQLDGRLEGYVIARGGSRQLLLSREGALEWFRAPAPSLPSLQIRMGAVSETGQVSGNVAGAAGGTVEIYRELPHAPRKLVAASPVAADGSFQADGLDPSPDALYRAVYADPATGIPFGLLQGVPVGTTG
ncbi:MAG TPA: hypothetical protein VF872_04255 [Gaiellaceae bacterium]